MSLDFEEAYVKILRAHLRREKKRGQPARVDYGDTGSGRAGANGPKPEVLRVKATVLARKKAS